MTEAKWVRCNNCFRVTSAQVHIHYPVAGEDNSFAKDILCPKCNSGHLWGLITDTTPDKVKKSREILEADRKRKKRSDASMIRDVSGTCYHVAYGYRLMYGFLYLNGYIEER